MAWFSKTQEMGQRELVDTYLVLQLWFDFQELNLEKKKKKKKVFTIAVNSNWGYFSKKEVEEKEEEEENSIYGGKKKRNTLSHSLQTWAKYS